MRVRTCTCMAMVACYPPAPHPPSCMEQGRRSFTIASSTAPPPRLTPPRTDYHTPPNLRCLRSDPREG